MFCLFAFWRCVCLSRGAQTNNSRFDCPENIFFSVSWVHYIQAVYSKEKCTIACVVWKRRNRAYLLLWHKWKELQGSKNWEKTLSNLWHLLITSSVHEGPNHATETWKKESFPLFVCLFPHFWFYSFRIFPSASAIRKCPVLLLQTPLLTLLTGNNVLTRGLPVDQIYKRLCL